LKSDQDGIEILNHGFAHSDAFSLKSDQDGIEMKYKTITMQSVNTMLKSDQDGIEMNFGRNFIDFHYG
jgi:hypothetical protein